MEIRKAYKASGLYHRDHQYIDCIQSGTSRSVELEILKYLGCALQALALKYHPDKNPDCVECRAPCQLLLSDEQQAAWIAVTVR